MTVYFFGVMRAGHAGHYSYGPDGRSLSTEESDLSGWYPKGQPWEHVDGALTPGERTERGRLREKGTQGHALIHRKDGWTAVAVHDFTGDSRPGSNAVFLIDEEVSGITALGLIAAQYPKLVRRIGPIILSGDEPGTIMPPEDRS